MQNKEEMNIIDKQMTKLLENNYEISNDFENCLTLINKDLDEEDDNCYKATHAKYCLACWDLEDNYIPKDLRSAIHHLTQIQAGHPLFLKILETIIREQIKFVIKWINIFSHDFNFCEDYLQKTIESIEYLTSILPPLKERLKANGNKKDVLMVLNAKLKRIRHGYEAGKHKESD